VSNNSGGNETRPKNAYVYYIVKYWVSMTKFYS
jgi:hypothetical protein